MDKENIKSELTRIECDVRKERTTLTTGKQLFALLISGPIMGNRAYADANIPNLIEKGNSLNDDYNRIIDEIGHVLDDIKDKVSFSMVDATLKADLLAFFNRVPHLCDTAENMIASQLIKNSVRNELSKATSRAERKFYTEVFEMIQFLLEIAPKIMYIRYNYSDDSELVYLEQNKKIIAPKNGVLTMNLLYSVRPCTERAFAVFKFNELSKKDNPPVLPPEDLALVAGYFGGENDKEAQEGNVMFWIDVKGKRLLF